MAICYAGMAKMYPWVTIVKKRGVADVENNRCKVGGCVKKSLGEENELSNH